MNNVKQMCIQNAQEMLMEFTAAKNTPAFIFETKYTGLDSFGFDTHKLMMLDGNNVAGYVDYIVEDDEVYIEFTTTSKEYRGKGYGKLLYTAFAVQYMMSYFDTHPTIGRYIVSPGAYNIAQWVMKKGILPRSTWGTSALVNRNALKGDE